MNHPDWSDFESVALDTALRGLAEDGASRDAATDSLGEQAMSPRKALAVSRSRLVLCGWRFVEIVYGLLGGVEVERAVGDGTVVPPGTVLGSVRGPGGVLLRGERLALNVLARLSGIATATRVAVDAVAGTGTEILDTRKTTPGMRALERYAVRCGGGVNHRFDLVEMAMFKDNHRMAAGGAAALAPAVARARLLGVPVEIEVDCMEQLEAVLPLSPDRILLDNMDPALAGSAVAACRGSGAYVEASGGIHASNARLYAEAGVDGISLGSITHSAPASDIAFDWEGT